MRPPQPDPPQTQRSTPQSRCGAVLIVVLGLLAVLSLLTLQASRVAIRHLEERFLLTQGGVPDVDLRNELASGIDAAIAALQVFRAETNGLFNPTAEGWDRPLETLEITDGLPPGLTVQVHDDSARIPLLRLPRDTLRTAFAEMNLSRSEAGVLADSLLDWIDDDGDPLPRGGEDLAYRREAGPAGFRIRPPNSVVEDTAAFRLIPAFRNAFFDGSPEAGERLQFLNRHFSFGNTPMNLNSATPETLDLVETLADVTLPYALREQPTERDPSYQPVLRDRIAGEVPDWIATAAQRIRIRAEIRRSDRIFFREAVLNVRGADVEDPQPFRIRSGVVPSQSASTDEPAS